MTSLPLYYDVTNPRYYDVTNPRYYDGTAPATMTSLPLLFSRERMTLATRETIFVHYGELYGVKLVRSLVGGHLCTMTALPLLL